MLDALRRGVANLLAKLLLGLLVIAFAFWGIGDYLVRGPQQGALATVGKTKITEEDYKQAYNEEVEAIARRLGRKLTPEQAQILGVPSRALARLIGTSAIDQHARELGVTVEPQIVASILRGQHPELVGADGRLDMNKYVELVRQSGYRSLGEYENARRQDLVREQLTETLGAAVTVPQFLVDALLRFRDETRVIEYVTPDFAKLVTVAEPSPEKLKEYFAQNERKYKAQEERKANVLLVSRDFALKQAKVTDEEIKAAYEAAKGTYDVPEKRRIQQLTFADKPAAEKAYAELSKAKDFNEAAAKLGFSANDIQLGAGLLTKSEMIDPKIADAAFALKKDELSRPVEGQYSVVLLRVPEIAPGKTRTFDEVKGEIRERIAGERITQQLHSLHERIEAGRAKGAPIKEIAQELNLPLIEVSNLVRTGKAADGKAPIAHADAGRIAEAVFAATPGVETEIIELSDSGYAWFELLDVTPERPRTFEEAAAEVKGSFMEEERRREIANLVSKSIDGRTPGEGLEKIAKALNAKVERTPPLKRAATPPAGLTAALLQEAFGMAKGDVASLATPDGKGRVIFRVAEITPAAAPKAEETAAVKEEMAKQLRVDLLDEYVAALRGRFGFTVNEKRLTDVIGGRTSEN